ncbi:hypothetical protein EQM13_10470 [Acidilutibacter cellobiosedens]|jgi:hypothetical protein|uniref:Uncharacterized protein n=1 Tax=Acidilutibacter cellobiosedens TaxID=2507161 RepID=A0A410QDH3_9FIRM|nr:hypothetical protein [Acidilutibacter cellobiosedens]QAT61979.1 hypothetical protein EQM13_10470 [Acidilutibacter cellobiosedens]
MRTDAVIRQEGMDVLIEKLGKVDAERFITLIIREPFDYTKWQENLFEDLTVRELSEKAMECIKNNEE